MNKSLREKFTFSMLDLALDMVFEHLYQKLFQGNRGLSGKLEDT